MSDPLAAIKEAALAYDAAMTAIGGCSDGDCLVKRPTGMHTNGGCRCWRDHMTAQRTMRAAYRLHRALEEALKTA